MYELRYQGRSFGLHVRVQEFNVRFQSAYTSVIYVYIGPRTARKVGSSRLEINPINFSHINLHKISTKFSIRPFRFFSIYGMPPCGRVRVQPASPQLLSGISGHWIISSSALYLLEQMYEIENDPPLHMRQRLATDLEVSQRQVSARARPPVRARPGSLQPSF